MSPEPRRFVDILLVEDNPGDVRLTQEALKSGKVVNRIHIARDGVEALQFLRKEGKHATAERPDIILLDLNLPRLDGREVLAEIKRDPDLRGIPVVVLTTSREEEDIVRAYELQASCYLSKPIEFEKFLSLIRSFEDFWLGIVRLPPHADGASD